MAAGAHLCLTVVRVKLLAAAVSRTRIGSFADFRALPRATKLPRLITSAADA
jgi:hypothetical protein